MPTYLHIAYQPRPLRTTVASFLTLNGISTAGLRNRSSRHMLRHHRNNNHRHRIHNICPFKNENRYEHNCCNKIHSSVKRNIHK